MSDSHFFLKIQNLDQLKAIDYRGQPLVLLYGELTDMVARTCGRSSAAIFAEPLLSPATPQRPGSISWYSASQGVVRHFGEVDAREQTKIIADLHALYVRLAPSFADDDYGEALAMAFNVPSSSDILLVGQEVVLTNWGFHRNDADHSTRNVFEQLGIIPVRAAAEPPTVIPSAPEPQPPSKFEPVLLDQLQPRVLFNIDWRRPLIAFAALLILFIVLANLGWVSNWWTDWRTSTTQISSNAPSELLKVQKDINNSLEVRIKSIGSQMSSGSCTLQDATPLPLRVPLPSQNGPTTKSETQGTTQSSGGSSNPSNPPATSTPPTAKRPATPTLPPQNNAGDGAFVQALDLSTVMVLAVDAGPVGHGTGFFVSENVIVTNQHVVSADRKARYFVINPHLGKLTPATVVATSKGSDFFREDFAVLKISGANGTPIKFGGDGQRLETVVAAGYPGFLMETDAAFQQLLEGNSDAVPQMAVTQGIITARQKGPTGLAVLAHTAEIAPGNSGGPLVDPCGQLIGVNTFYRADETSAARANFSLEASGLRRFLKSHDVVFSEGQSECRPNNPSSPINEPRQP